MTKLFVGYDGGGTKTAAVLADEDGRLLGVGVAGPSNYLYCGRELAAASVKEATALAFKNAGLEPCRLHTAYMASAAIKLLGGAAHVPFFSSCINAEQVLCESDLFPIWYGAVGDAPAVVSIAGTGAITYVCSKEEFRRVGGYGPLLGDEGSGYELALRALRTACRMYDGREPMDQPFMDALFCHYGVKMPLELVRELNAGDIRSKVADCCKTIFDLYEKGNSEADRLLQQSADEIALAVRTAADHTKCKKPIPVVFSGSLLQPNRALYRLLKKRLLTENSPISSFIPLEMPPAAASAALALHFQGYEAGAEALLRAAKGVVL